MSPVANGDKLMFSRLMANREATVMYETVVKLVADCFIFESKTRTPTLNFKLQNENACSVS